MQILRGVGKFFGSFLFTTFLVLAIMMVQLVGFTSYSNFNSFAGGILEQQIFSQASENSLSDLRNYLMSQCHNTDRVQVPMGGSLPIVLKCDDVNNSDNEKLKSLITSTITEGIYNKQYDCSFISCIQSSNKEDLLFLVSNQGNQFYENLQLYMWLGTAAGLALLLVSTEKWPGRLKGVGINLVATGVPFLLFGLVQSNILSVIPSESLSTVEPIINKLASDLKNIFLIVLVVGAVLLIAGYALGYYQSKKNKDKDK